MNEIELLHTLIEGQKSVLKEVESIRETVERLHGRLDDIHDKTIIHSEKIKVLEQKFCNAENKCNDEREKIWLKMRDDKEDAIKTAVKNVKLWIYGAVILGVSSFATAIIVAIVSINMK